MGTGRGTFLIKHRHRLGRGGQRIRARESRTHPAVPCSPWSAAGIGLAGQAGRLGHGLAVIGGTLGLMGLAMIWGQLPGTAQITLSVYLARLIQVCCRALVLSLFFSIAQVCGMAIRRGITAVVIALVIGLILTIPSCRAGRGQHAPGPGPVGHFGRASGGFVGMERRLAAGAASPWAMGAPWVCSSQACAVFW